MNTLFDGDDGSDIGGLFPEEELGKKVVYDPQLKPLRGSEKQKPWGETIRAEKLRACNHYIREHQDSLKRFSGTPLEEQIREKLGFFIDAMADLESETAASYWIERRGFSALDLLTYSEPPPNTWHAGPEPEGKSWKRQSWGMRR